METKEDVMRIKARTWSLFGITFIAVLEATAFVSTSALADSPSSGFCGALVQGKDAWYHNCTSKTVRKQDNLWLAWGTCKTIRPGATVHWHDLFNIRGIINC